MSKLPIYEINKASELQIAEHLEGCDGHFVPVLSARVYIESYAKKIFAKATRFEAWNQGELIGLVAAYYDQKTLISHITNVSVLPTWAGKGVATSLMNQSIKQAKSLRMKEISLEVGSQNIAAIGLYEKSGFTISKTGEPTVYMSLYLTGGAENE